MLPRRSATDHLSGDGAFTRRCHQWIEDRTGCAKALLTHSCTSALDLAALLLDLKSGDEVILPSYTFVSTANAFVLRGAVPVFVDIREDTLNLDERLIEDAITTRTRAIVPVHYAGVSCEMDSIAAIARRHDLRIVEDAAQGIMAGYKNRALGAIGDLGGFSFHETKNIISGEGGSLMVRDPDLVQRAEIIREKGTDRGRFFRGEVDKYTWQDVGSSFLPSEITAAFLWAQLEEAQRITDERIDDLAPLSRDARTARAARLCCAVRSCQRIASTTDTCITCCSRRDRSPERAGRAQRERSPRGVSLCPAAFIAGRHALRTRAWRSAADDVAVRAPDQAADVAGLDRSAAAAGLRRPERNPDEADAMKRYLMRRRVIHRRTGKIVKPQSKLAMRIAPITPLLRTDRPACGTCRPPVRGA